MRYIGSIITALMLLISIAWSQYDRGYIDKDMRDKIYGVHGAQDTVSKRGLWNIVRWSFASDTTELKSNSSGVYCYLNGYAAGSSDGSGWFVATDSLYAEGASGNYVAFDHPVKGKQWVRLTSMTFDSSYILYSKSTNTMTIDTNTVVSYDVYRGFADLIDTARIQLSISVPSHSMASAIKSDYGNYAAMPGYCTSHVILGPYSITTKQFMSTTTDATLMLHISSGKTGNVKFDVYIVMFDDMADTSGVYYKSATRAVSIGVSNAMNTVYIPVSIPNGYERMYILLRRDTMSSLDTVNDTVSLHGAVLNAPDMKH